MSYCITDNNTAFESPDISSSRGASLLGAKRRFRDEDLPDSNSSCGTAGKRRPGVLPRDDVEPELFDELASEIEWCEKLMRLAFERGQVTDSLKSDWSTLHARCGDFILRAESSDVKVTHTEASGLCQEAHRLATRLQKELPQGTIEMAARDQKAAGLATEEGCGDEAPADPVYP